MVARDQGEGKPSVVVWLQNFSFTRWKSSGDWLLQCEYT